MKKIILSLILFGTLIIFSSCNSASDADTPTDTQELQTNVMNVNDYEIDAQVVNERIANNENFYLIDVRTPEENAELKIPDSELMTLDNLADTIINDEDISFHDEIIVYCRSGNRSKTAYDILTQLGYTNVKSMAGGINEWSNLGYNTCSELNNTC